MTTAVIAVPGYAIGEIGDHWGRLRMTWTSAYANASGEHPVWEITNPSGGVFVRREGLRGLGMPKITHFRDQSPAVAGAIHRDLNFESRDVFWPLQIFHDGSSAEFIALDREFWASMNPALEGRWTVYMLDGTSRYLDLRIEDDGDWSPESDPTYFGWANYGIRLTADSPFWKTAPITRSWRTVAPVDFYADSPGVLGISGSRSIATAKITNPGDVPAYPVWTIHGPIDSAIVGVGDHLIEVSLELADGEYIVLDTNPNQQTATDHTGADRYEDLGEIDWRGWLEPGVETDLSIALDGDTGGRVDLWLQPQYLRGW